MAELDKRTSKRGYISYLMECDNDSCFESRWVYASNRFGEKWYCCKSHVIMSKKCRDKQLANHIKNPPNRGIIFNEKWRAKLSESAKKRWAEGRGVQSAQRHSKAETGWVKEKLETFGFEWNKKPFAGTPKIPDFIHITQKVIVEYVGDGKGKNRYFHDDNYEVERADYFSKIGYETLFTYPDDFSQVEERFKRSKISGG